MKNFIQPGKSIDFTAPAGGVVSGRPVVLGSLIGISSVTADEGKQASMETEGVFELSKVSAQAWVVGAKIYWDDTAKKVTTTATDNTLIGVSVEVAANPSSTGLVKLGPTTV